jgi:hypothetical protein
MQSDHIAQVGGRFERVGLVLTLDSDGSLFCRVCPESKCLFNPIDTLSEPVPTDEEIEEVEHELHLEPMAENIIDQMQQITQ